MRTGCEPTRFGNEAKTIIHGDALAELKKIPAESVDLIFAAHLPYNIGKNFDGLDRSLEKKIVYRLAV
ncbi:hypothetical protein ACLK1V_17780 [Escherichia coli]